MGQKTNPVGFRLGVSRDWDSAWFARGREFAEYLQEDMMIRNYIRTKMDRAQISRIQIERKRQELNLTVNTARAGLVIGTRGSTIDKLTKELKILTGGKSVRITVEEVRRPELDAMLVAENIARQIEKRISVRRAMKRAMSDAMRSGAEGIRICCAGRLGGAEMRRVNQYAEGKVPLHTLRAEIDFARHTAKTTYGTIGVKVWISHGEQLGEQEGVSREVSG